MLNAMEHATESIELDDLPYARGARFEREKGCLPGTRKTLLQEICEILNSCDEDAPRVCLLTGVAGSGKSAVAHSVSRLYDAQQRLGSSYCFSKTDVANCNPKNLFSTIARDLSDCDPQFKSALLQVVKNNRALRTSQSPVEQAERLIVEPSRHLLPIGPLVVVIDALDESGNEDTLPTNLRFLITARPETDILSDLPPGPHIVHKQLGDIWDPLHQHTEAIEPHSLNFDATTPIRHMVNQTVRSMPRVLINTTTGRLYDRKQQAAAFEELPIYGKLVSSMVTQLDRTRIYREVKQFYRYVMLSHKWEEDEPLLQKVENISVYDLEPSPANMKLRNFCWLVRSLGFRWAWSDTCCVDKSNNVVLQESLVAMFTWYRGSSLTIVYLRGVSSKYQYPGSLQKSIWNTRAWTYQEYIAAETVQFYTEDWKPYLDLTLSNHKESPIIISEMQEATGVTAKEMAVLRSGLDRVREKLYLASSRETTLVEDAAYSLFGIFNVAIPAIYGEGNRAVGRLLEHILTGSRDITILAWTGSASSYNSCLPMDLTVYNQLVPPHIPPPIKKAELDNMVAALRSSLPDPSLAVLLYDRLYSLPSPSLSASRLQLPGIVFHLTDLVRTSDRDPVTNVCVYHAMTSMFGEIEIKTADDLLAVDGRTDLYLVHPWIRPLLDQEFSAGAAALDKTTQALRFVVRLGQPFGALLFASVSRVEYRRVAADGLIVVRVREGVELMELMEGIRSIEVQWCWHEITPSMVVLGYCMLRLVAPSELSVVGSTKGVVSSCERAY
ncbi:hypothetical protein OG21DRAFT_789639 [Imleria badia]|nr:hypothetical protein OG21DRAFT_789639 [Imleria badia]